LADAVEEGQGFEVGVGDGVGGGGDFGADFVAKAGLDFGVKSEQVAGPG
jgi:hypothetical protein